MGRAVRKSGQGGDNPPEVCTKCPLPRTGWSQVANRGEIGQNVRNVSKPGSPDTLARLEQVLIDVGIPPSLARQTALHVGMVATAGLPEPRQQHLLAVLTLRLSGYVGRAA